MILSAKKVNTMVIYEKKTVVYFSEPAFLFYCPVGCKSCVYFVTSLRPHKAAFSLDVRESWASSEKNVWFFHYFLSLDQRSSGWKGLRERDVRCEIQFAWNHNHHHFSHSKLTCRIFQMFQSTSGSRGPKPLTTFFFFISLSN